MGVAVLVRSWVGAVSPGLLFSGFIAGVVVQLQQASLWQGGLYAVLAALAVLAGVAVGILYGAAALKKKSTLRAAGLAVSVFVAASLLGFGLTGWRATAFQSAALKPALEGRDIAVTGVVLAMPQPSEDALRFRLGIESARLNGQAVSLPPQILLGWYAGFGTRDAKSLPVESADPSEFALALQRQPQTLRAGERWQMTVRLKAPHGNSNPHGFDYELWLWEQGIQATGYVRAGPHDEPPSKLSSSWAHPVERARQSVREAIFARVENRQLAGVIAALVVGDQNAIERADWDVFRATGVAHLMSISGLHITMFAWAASLLVGGLWRRSARLTPRLWWAVSGRSVRAVFRLGRARPANHLDAGDGGGAAAKRQAVALAADLVAGHGRGGGAGSLGADAGRVLVVVCRGGRFVCYRFRSA